jgi:hypothetical protein
LNHFVVPVAKNLRDWRETRAKEKEAIMGENIVTIYQFAPAKDLQLLAYFARANRIEVQNATYPRFAATGDLPQVSFGSFIANGDRAIALLKSLNKEASSYSEQQKAAIVTLESLILSGTLSDVAEWARLHSHIHTIASSRSTISPLCYFVPRVHDESTAKHLAARGFIDEEYCKYKALEAYQSLAMAFKEEDKAFFFGANACSLDAVLFGHLDAIRLTRAGDWLKEAAPSLVTYYSRLRKMYFSDNSPYAVASVGSCSVMKGTRANLFAEIEAAVDTAAALRIGGKGAVDEFTFGEASQEVISQALTMHSKSTSLASLTFEEAAINVAIVLTGVTSFAALYFMSLR